MRLSFISLFLLATACHFLHAGATYDRDYDFSSEDTYGDGTDFDDGWEVWDEEERPFQLDDLDEGVVDDFEDGLGDLDDALDDLDDGIGDLEDAFYDFDSDPDDEDSIIYEEDINLDPITGYDDYYRRHNRRGQGHEDRPSSAALVFDDASASANSIPSGYFKETEPPAAAAAEAANNQMQSRRPGFDSSMRLPIFDSLSDRINEMSWWRSRDRNVCKRRIQIRKSIDAQSQRSASSVFWSSTRCRAERRDQYRCRVKSWRGRNSFAEFDVVYSCCPGFARVFGDKGCPREIDSKPKRNFTEVLQQIGYKSEQAQLLKTAFYNATKHGMQSVTVFLPLKSALSNFTDNLHSSSSSNNNPLHHIFASTGRQANQLRQKLKTKLNSTIFFTRIGAKRLANCVPIVQTDIPFSNASIAHVTQRVLPVVNETVFDIARRVMVEKWNKEAEWVERALKPLKSDSPITVFLHKPVTAGISANRYARSLEAFSMTSGHICSQSFHSRQMLSTVRNFDIEITKLSDDGSLQLNGNCAIVAADLLGVNGIVHLVSKSLAG